MGYKSVPLETAKQKWETHVKRYAEQRVFNLVALYGQDPRAFEVAFNFHPPKNKLNYLEAGYHLFVFCCGLVSSNWNWSIKFCSDGTQEVRVNRLSL